MLDKLTVADFAPLLKQTFLIYYSETDYVETQLIEAKALSFDGDDDEQEDDFPRGRQAFSLIFRSGDKSSYLRQQIYTVKHAQFGALDLFLVPIGSDKHGMRYQAIFS
jgi:hypothetical protein